MIGGKLWCWLLRGHKWRRLRKGERTGQIDADWRICARCEAMRTVKRRAKQEKGI